MPACHNACSVDQPGDQRGGNTLLAVAGVSRNRGCWAGRSAAADRMNRSSAGAEEVARLQRTDLTQSADLTLTKRTSNSSVLGISRGGGSPTASARGRIWRRGQGLAGRLVGLRCCSRCSTRLSRVMRLRKSVPDEVSLFVNVGTCRLRLQTRSRQFERRSEGLLQECCHPTQPAG